MKPLQNKEKLLKKKFKSFLFESLLECYAVIHAGISFRYSA